MMKQMLKWVFALATVAGVAVAGEPAALNKIDMKKMQGEAKKSGAELVGSGSYTLAEEKDCEAHQIMGAMMAACQKAGASLEEVMLDNGMARVMTAKDAKSVAAVQAACLKSDADMKALMMKDNPSLCEECVHWREWMGEHRLHHQMAKMKMGMMGVATTEDLGVLQEMKAMAMKKMSAAKDGMKK